MVTELVGSDQRVDGNDQAGFLFHEPRLFSRCETERARLDFEVMASRKRKGAVNKSEFVRNMAPGTPAKDVVNAAKKRGIKLTERYVYVIRSSDKAKARRRGPGRVGKRSGAGAEQDSRLAIAELGLARARQIMAEVEAAFGTR